jgi:hypothetical protein
MSEDKHDKNEDKHNKNKPDSGDKGRRGGRRIEEADLGIKAPGRGGFPSPQQQVPRPDPNEKDSGKGRPKGDR